MKLAKFVKYGGSTMPRLFLHHAAWEIGEIRAVNEEEAKELKRHFDGSFEINDPQPPPRPLRPAEKPASNQPVDPAKE